MLIPSCINVFIFPHVLRELRDVLIIDPSFTENSHIAKLSCVFILHVLVFFFNVHVQGIHFGYDGVNGQQGIMIIW